MKFLLQYHSSECLTKGFVKLLRHRKLLFIAGRSNSSNNFRVNIGDVSLIRSQPKHPEFVPVNYSPDASFKSQYLLHHLRWIMQKDKLGQDIFLIGPPGTLKRLLAMQYLELTKKEVEYISLSRDTTESDIKQRREIVNRTALYIDQCAVRAAIEGRILVLDGIEKAERNVLPVLNNLLENREMQLEDGRFLMAADRYDKLLNTYSKEEMDQMNLVRVHESFRVIALGLPVPRYQGNPLDPPLRSRFQARDVNPLPFKDCLDVVKCGAKSIPEEKILLLLSAAYTFHSTESKSLGLPDFPLDQLPYLVKVMEKIPFISVHEALNMVYPYKVFLNSEGQEAVKSTLKKFDIQTPKESKEVSIINVEDKQVGTNEYVLASINEQVKSQALKYNVLAGSRTSSQTNSSEKFIDTNYLQQFFSQIMHSHSVKDFCIIGPKGCGKSALMMKFADILGYEPQPIMLYADMTARDLLQQRTTESNGDTNWKFSPLVTAALKGQLAILDGLHRINAGTLSIIHRLVHERELQLFNGVRLLRADRYDKIKHHQELSDKELQNMGIFRIHPSFRLVALSEPPVIGSSTQQWLNAELLSLFFFHTMQPLSMKEELDIIVGVTNIAPERIDKILKFTHGIRKAQDTTLQSIASSLSTRQLLRIAHRMKKYSNESEYDAIYKACLGRFLPPLPKMALNQMLNDFDIKSQKAFNPSVEHLEKAITCEVKGGRVRIGSIEHEVFSPESKAQVPDVLFYDNIQHLSVMEDMLKDFSLGQHLLLVGNQGVGKNKIVDRFLHLLNRPREYLQLHRDTTVQSLTLQPTVHEGIIKYEDSPLVSAVKNGHILVIDEADKAPTNVTCILKTLVESGNMILADGRRIVKHHGLENESENIIKMHPDFRMIVLANRPGFPFLGNDFMGALGDIFSCHAVDNPSMESEIEMLQKYGPNVDLNVIRKLVEAFGELRLMADEGLIAYPYSTREIVNIIKHLEVFPNEGLATVVRNVFDFDPYSEELWETVKQTLQKHGIPIGIDIAKVTLAKEFPMPELKLMSIWDIKKHDLDNKAFVLPMEKRKIFKKPLPNLEVVFHPMDRVDSRTAVFGEEEMHWRLPIGDYNVVLDIATTKYGHQMKDIIHVATGNPIALYSMIPYNRTVYSADLHNVFNYTRGGYQAKIRLGPLGGNLIGSTILHEGISNKLFIIDVPNGAITQLNTETLLQATAKEIGYRIQGIDRGHYKMCSEFAEKNFLVFYQNNGNHIEVMDFNSATAYNVVLPFKLGEVQLVSPQHWLLTEKNLNRKYLLKTSKANDDQVSPHVNLLYEVVENPEGVFVNQTSQSELSSKHLMTVLNQKTEAPNRIFKSARTFVDVAVGFPELESSLEIHSCPRPEDKVHSAGTNIPNSVFSVDCGQIISPVPGTYHPDYNPDKVGSKSEAFLEVVDVVDKKIRYVPVPRSQTFSPYTTWVSTISPSHILASGTSNNGVVTIDEGGSVRLWETAIENLKQSLMLWKNLRGVDSNHPIQVTIDEPNTQEKELSEPKHGKIDPQNMPHVGGGTWAGGSGGRSTAGLGGVGGPYRLDSGHDVHQVPDYIKDKVPEEVRRAAREMGQRAYKERLRQIQMSEFDAELYEQFMGNIKSHIQSMKVILDSLQAKSKERQWLKHQTFGELDDMKLIDGLTGEKSVYKRRSEKEPELGAPQEKPKKLKLLVDVSGSMYRFNGHDGRLHRIMEAALLVMEAFEKYGDKFQYDIIGHSGDTYAITFVKALEAPKNNKVKIDILKEMHAHSQFCLSGDNTLEATIHATETLAKEDADERFVIILSDANFDRYGIKPTSLTRALTSNPNVNSFAIFIGSLGDQAIRLQNALPSGRGFVCLDTKLIPNILRQIFTSNLLT